MFLNNRYESKELLKLRALSRRMTFSREDQMNYLYAEKGFEGERNFDLLLEEKLSNEWIIISDLLLKQNNKEFQIDSLLVSKGTLYPIEVKHYEGDHYIEKDLWFRVSTGKEIGNPLMQLNRSASLLRSLLQEMNSKFSVEPYLVFTNPKFTLYNAPREPQIIFPTQLDNFFEKLNMRSSQLNDNHMNFAKRLFAKRLHESKHAQVLEYEYDHLKKGITCMMHCGEFLFTVVGRKLICDKCGHVEGFDAAVLRSVEELKLLFPDRKITVNNIHDWCNLNKSKRAIRRVLLNHFEAAGVGKYRYYVKPLRD